MKHTFSVYSKDGATYTVETDEIDALSDEGRVFSVLLDRYNNNEGPIQKHALCQIVNDRGAHERHESPRKRTSMRKMQQLLRNLRGMSVPILSHVKHGIWISRSAEEIWEYADWLDRKAKADIKSMLEVRDLLLLMVPKEPPSLFDRLF